MLVFGVFLFLLGAVLASFVGLIVARLYTGASILSGRSRCDTCGATLRAFDLVPIVSWVASLGRCASCKTKISPVSTLAELALGALFVFAYLKLGLSLPLAIFCIALTLILALVLYDLRHGILPPIFLYPLLALSIVFRLVVDGGVVLTSYEIPVVIALSLFFIHYLSRGRAMGLADSPFALALAILTAETAFSGIVFAFWIGALFGVVILARTPRGHRIGIEVPFAPYLASGFLLAYLTSWNVLTFLSPLLF